MKPCLRLGIKSRGLKVLMACKFLKFEGQKSNSNLDSQGKGGKRVRQVWTLHEDSHESLQGRKEAPLRAAKAAREQLTLKSLQLLHASAESVRL